MKKKNLLLTLVCICMFMFVGCTSNAENNEQISISITGFSDGSTIDFTIEELQMLPVCEQRVEGDDSQGELVVFDVKGAYLEDLLQQHGKSTSDLESIRITASDGYSIDVAKDILIARDIILAYEMDGKELDDENAPLRVFIPDERSMYWVRMVNEIIVSEKNQRSEVNEICFFESLYLNENADSFYDNNTNKIDTTNFIDTYNRQNIDVIRLLSSDGLDKQETVVNLKKGYILLDGADSPEFTSDELPVGMHVRDLLVLQYGDLAYYSISQGMGDRTSIDLQQILDTCGMRTDVSILIVAQGEDVTLDSQELTDYMIEISDKTLILKNNTTDELILEDIASIKIQ